MFKKVWQWILSKWYRFFPKKPEGFVIERCIDEPQSLKTDILYLIGEAADEWAAAFICPCGCGELIMLNLLRQSGRPIWTVSAGKDGIATLHPSVWRNVGCKSHFIMRDGVIIWCGTGHPPLHDVTS
ncbi:hypothetical protein FEM03_07460 [Phragmitibacter flavus]|uniref:Uncharacterized protein n=1 Tax=Phragmitibacter flavus TaxID=2576071 RepID=A0A5R8KIB4_9BACT|nr:DUF6527 family protein [Phragmitibacter flavus]TLD71359.1 hypothetical protein FEM03_07460 [Phragmitibacter flavus]